MDRAGLVLAVVVLAAGVFIQSGRLARALDWDAEMLETTSLIRRRLHAFWDDQAEEIDDPDGFEWGPLAVCAMHDIGQLIVESPWADELEVVYGELDYDLPFEIEDEDADD